MEVRLRIRKGRLVCLPLAKKGNATIAEKLDTSQRIVKLQEVELMPVEVGAIRNQTPRLSVITVMKKGITKVIARN